MDEQRLITVTGTASEKLPANHVVISISAVGEADVYWQAVTDAEILSDGAVTELKAAGIDNVREAGVSVNVVSEGRKTVGYKAVRRLTAEFKYDKAVLSKALDVLAKSRCECRLSFSLKDTDMKDKLIARAVAEAKASAEVIAKSAGVRLGALVKADYASSSGHVPMRMSLSMTNIAEPEEISLSETVTCAWEIK